jgi:hypothetical protein
MRLRTAAIGATALAVLATATAVALADASEPGERVVTLVTGERVHVTPTTAVLESGGRAQTLAANGKFYVVPQMALPYIGRQFDVSLFDVLSPVTDVVVTEDDGSSRTVTASSVFGTGLPALDGIRSIRSAKTPVVVPNFPQATLEVDGVNRLGLPANGTITVINVDDTERFIALAALGNGEASFSVPEGNYTLVADITTPGSTTTAPEESRVVLTQVSVTGPQTSVTADARTATTLVPAPTTPKASTPNQFATSLHRVSAAGTEATMSEGFIGAFPTLYVTPVKDVTIGALDSYTYFHLVSTQDGGGYVYDVAFPSDGSIPASYPTRVDPASLARIDTTYASDVDGHRVATYRAPLAGWERMSLAFTTPATAPLRRDEYVSGLTGLGWVSGVVWNAADSNGFASTQPIEYRAGATLADTYLRSPIVPGGPTGTLRPQPCGACRQDTLLALNLAAFTDSGGHAIDGLVPTAELDVSVESHLFRAGVELASVKAPAGTFTVPGGQSDYRLTVDTVKAAPWTTTSTRTSTAWTWHSTPSTGPLPALRTCPGGSRACGFEPLLFLAYDPASTASSVGFRVQAERFAPAPTGTAATLEVSADDGATWTGAPVTADGAGHFTASVTPPAGATALSLRVHATGGTSAVDQTIVRALPVP